MRRAVRSLGAACCLASALLASACSAPSSDPFALRTIPATSPRLVATPVALAALAPGQRAAGLPGQITFGDSNGRSALYLKFAPAWRAHGAPLAGFLSLEPRTGATPESAPVTIEVWRVRSAWQPSQLRSWSDKPELAPPYTRAIVSGSPAHTLRIDITELLRFAANNPDLDQGIALIARGGSGHGVSFSTGIAGGRAPELEVFGASAAP